MAFKGSRRPALGAYMVTMHDDKGSCLFYGMGINKQIRICFGRGGFGWAGCICVYVCIYLKERNSKASIV